MFRMGKWSPFVVIAVAALSLAGCGGHGGGGGSGGSSAAVLSMVGVPSFGTRTGSGATATTTTGAFNVTTPSLATQVGPTDFAGATAANQANYFEIQFSKNLLASTITNGLNNGSEGILLQTETGARVAIELDLAGAIDATNVSPAPGVAPSLLRVYVNDSTLAAPRRLPAGQYKLAIIPQNLRGANNEPFCVQTTSAGGCLQSPSVLYSFTVGGDTIAPTAAPSGFASPVVNAQIDNNSEIRVFFSENIDFQSIVRTTTAKDRFCSRTFQLNNIITPVPPPAPPPPPFTSNGENVTVIYTPPPGSGIGPNRGFICYMPDPFHNPTEMRIRFVDISNLTFTDGVAGAQNYGLDSNVYKSAGQPIPVNFNNAPLSLPPILPLPGSTVAGLATLVITFLNPTNALATDNSSNGDGVAGVTDRARNPIANDLVINYTLKTGPQVGNNPGAMYSTFITNNNKINVVSSGKLTSNGLPTGVVVGALNLAPVPLDNINTLGQILDVEFGQYVNFTGAGNFFGNDASRLAVPVVTDNNGDRAIPFPQGGTPEINVCAFFVNPPPPPPTPLIGTFMYVVDFTHSEVRVFDSNSYTLLTTLVGVPKPGGLGANPNYTSLYVSNIDQGTVQRVNINPFQPTFHTVLNTITVGSQPRAISVNPANEDVFVINSGDNSVSIIDVPLQSERARLTVGSGPRDIFVTDRFNCMNCTLAYMAFVTNFFDNTVSVYESDSADPRVNNGPQGKIIDTLTGFQGPSGGTWNRSSAIGQVRGMGAVFPNSLGTSIEDRGCINFGLSPTPGFQGPAGFRTFATQHVYATNTQATGSSDCVIDVDTAMAGAIAAQCNGPVNSKVTDIIQAGGANPAVLLAAYPGTGNVVAYDFNNGAVLGSITVSGNMMYTYFDQ